MKTSISSLIILTALIAVWTSSPAFAVEIRKSQQLYTVTPAMMHAIDVIVREEMHMRHQRGRNR